jgi:hypothetical protein
MGKESKNIRSGVVKESLLDYETVTNSIKEESASIIKDLLGETVKDQVRKILNEADDDKEYEEVEDSDTETTETDPETGDTEETDVNTETEEAPDGEETTDTDVDTTETDPDSEVEDDLGLETDEEEWGQFDKYKVDDTDEYDLSNADTEDIVKIYKLLKNDDQVSFKKDGEKIEINDKETGSEYLIDLGGENTEDFDPAMGDEPDVEGDTDFDFGDEEGDLDENQTIYEIALGYTDNYQNKDAITNNGSMKEPGKNVNDIDKGVPTGTTKPFAGQTKSKGKPFKAQVSEETEEPIVDGEGEGQVEEATNVGGFVQQNTTPKSHVPNSSGRDARNASIAGEKVKGTADPRYSKGGLTNEQIQNIMRKTNEIFKENKELKSALGQFRKSLQEAALTNVKMGQIVKLIIENSTTADEKKDIIARFSKSANTIEEAKTLYESINDELKKKKPLRESINEQFSVEDSKLINEQPIYKSKETMRTLELMGKINKM